MVVHWLALCAFSAGAWVQSLVEELRDCKLYGTAKKTITTENSLAVQCLTVVQWLGLCAFTVENAVSIPGWGIKFP